MQRDWITPPATGLALRLEGLGKRFGDRAVLHDVVLVPESAVVRTHDAQVVVLADAGHARVVPVSVQGRHGGLAAVAGEVREGQRVIVSGGYNLPDGAGITATEAPAALSTGSAEPR